MSIDSRQTAKQVFLLLVLKSNSFRLPRKCQGCDALHHWQSEVGCRSIFVSRFSPCRDIVKGSASPIFWFKNHHVFFLRWYFSWDHPTFSWTKKNGGGPSHLVLPLCLWAKFSTIGSPRQGASSLTISVGEDSFPFKKDLLERTTKNANLRYFFHHHLVIGDLFRPSNIAGGSIKNSRRGTFLLAKTQDVWRNPKLTPPVFLVISTLGFSETTPRPCPWCRRKFPASSLLWWHTSSQSQHQPSAKTETFSMF